MFLAADSKEDFSALPKIAKSMSGAAALWIVYPKGQKHITENDVLAAGRKSGLKDVKVVGFSATHTALKFVIPLACRQQTDFHFAKAFPNFEFRISIFKSMMAA